MTAAPELIVEEYDDSDGELMIGEAVGLTLRPTGFILRGAGAAIDLIVYLGLWLLMITALGILGGYGLFDEAVAQAAIVVTLVLCIVVIPLTVELVTRGRSLGKLAVGARIVRDDGGAIGFRHAFTRALTGILELFFTLGGMAAFIALFNSKAKRLGDLIAGTYSQNERISRYNPPAFGVPMELAVWAQSADVARMPDQVARRISQFLSSAAHFTPQARASVSFELAREASPYVSPIPSVNPELFLAAIAAIRRDREFAALQRQKQTLATLAPAMELLPRGFPER